MSASVVELVHEVNDAHAMAFEFGTTPPTTPEAEDMARGGHAALVAALAKLVNLVRDGYDGRRMRSRYTGR
jgi:hypothetical protein